MHAGGVRPVRGAALGPGRERQPLARTASADARGAARPTAAAPAAAAAMTWLREGVTMLLAMVELRSEGFVRDAGITGGRGNRRLT